MGQVVYLGLCLLAGLLLNTLVEGAGNDTVAARSSCPHGIFYYNKNCYEYFPEGLSWKEAEEECTTLRSDALLVFLSNPKEQKALLAHLKRKRNLQRIWIGLSAPPAAPTGQGLKWKWSNGVSYNPDNLSQDDDPTKCMSLSMSGYPQQKITECSDKLPYVCKYSSFFY
ncbi:regenerating islet-derived protein 3-beta-like [Paroedura picta]|uniref:regenerating islet-derived protein 3-beta-like n=1 Tax=Paroedura picta TaxID=143630 RepID=UPI00405755A7